MITMGRDNRLVDVQIKVAELVDDVTGLVTSFRFKAYLGWGNEYGCWMRCSLAHANKFFTDVGIEPVMLGLNYRKMSEQMVAELMNTMYEDELNEPKAS